MTLGRYILCHNDPRNFPSLLGQKDLFNIKIKFVFF